MTLVHIADQQVRLAHELPPEIPPSTWMILAAAVTARGCASGRLKTTKYCARSAFCVQSVSEVRPRKMRRLSNLLTKFTQKGSLGVFDSGGTLHSFGEKAPGPTVT